MSKAKVKTSELDPPPDLDALERAEWDRVTKELDGKGAIDRVDRASLIAYCASWARWWRCHRQVAATGGEVVKSPSGFPIQNPWLCAANQAQTQMLRFSRELNLTPRARRRH